MDGLEMVRGFMARGYSPHQAAALAGHALQESGGNPAAVNPGEGANGLMQWRLDRWQGLQDYAKAQGKSPTDPNVQMDFVGQEFAGPEKKAASAFLAAPDVASASAALKPYIRFGDDSASARLANANNLFSQVSAAPVGALASAAPVAPIAAPAVAPAPAAPAAPALSGQVGALGKALAGKPEEFAPVQPLQMPQSNTGQSQQIAAALAKAYGFGA